MQVTLTSTAGALHASNNISFILTGVQAVPLGPVGEDQSTSTLLPETIVAAQQLQLHHSAAADAKH